MKINEKVLDQLLAECESPERIEGENGLLKQLTKAVLERALEAEMSHHLGYEKHAPAGRNSGNSRNGSTSKKLQGDFGAIEPRTPRDRNAEFEPRIVAKGQRPTAARRLRSEDRLAVRAGHDDARDPSAFRRKPRRRGEPGADLQSHRRGER